MKIYMIHVAKEFQPETSKFIYHMHSSYIEVECEFYNSLIKQEDILTEDSDDWCKCVVKEEKLIK